MDQQAEKDKTERVTGLGRRTREEIAKWNEMTALRFQTGGRHQTSPASLRGNKNTTKTTTTIKTKRQAVAKPKKTRKEKKTKSKTRKNL